jgi:hypothetical protein
MIKSRRMKWVGYVACMGRIKMHVGFLWESQKERDQWEELEVGGRILIMKWVLENRMGWYNGFIWLRLRTSKGFL